MKVHIVARDSRDREWLQVAADDLAAAVGGEGPDYLLFSDDDEEFVNVVTLSPSVARRLGGPGLCESGRRNLMLEVVAAVVAASSGVPDGEAVH